ncbi:Dehydrogenase/reductase SDR family member 7, partial [Ophiophagus hannah]
KKKKKPQPSLLLIKRGSSWSSIPAALPPSLRAMEICVSCIAVWSFVAYLILQIVRWIRADSDLTVQWAEWWGKKPVLLISLVARTQSCIYRILKLSLSQFTCGNWTEVIDQAHELPRKVVWVTGASSGIGEELAYQLAKIGSWLVLSARRENELERVKKKCLEISSLSDKDILILPLDLTDRGSHELATKTVLQHFGRIDILVNNGGRSQRSLFVDTSVNVYNAIMELNYLGTISLTKFALDHMIQRKQGKIVTMSSVMGVMGAPLATGYCASKHALQVNQNVGDQSHKMTTHRCARLTLVSMANDVKEAWISDHPYLAICYMWQYLPTWAWWLLNCMGKKRIENFKSGVDADVSYYKKSS